MSYRGIAHYFNRTGLGRFKKVVLDNGLDTTPVDPPLHIKASSAPSATQVLGDMYVDTAGALRVSNGTEYSAANGVPLATGAGTGITTGTGTIYRSSVVKHGGIIKTEILIDLTGLNSSTAGDIIGKDGGTANCHFGQITTAQNGTILAGLMTCLEAPAAGEPDIDLWCAVESTGAEDAALGSTLTETALLDAAADWTINTQKALTGMPVADNYLYLGSSGGGDAATYTGGKFLIELWGYVA